MGLFIYLFLEEVLGVEPGPRARSARAALPPPHSALRLLSLLPVLQQDSERASRGAAPCSWAASSASSTSGPDARLSRPGGGREASRDAAAGTVIL